MDLRLGSTVVLSSMAFVEVSGNNDAPLPNMHTAGTCWPLRFLTAKPAGTVLEPALPGLSPYRLIVLALIPAELPSQDFGPVHLRHVRMSVPWNCDP